MPKPASPARTIPIALFDGKSIASRGAQIRTLGDCLDHGRVLLVKCGCNTRIVEVRPQRLFALKDGPTEAARLAELRHWLRCDRCGRHDRVTVRANDKWRGGGDQAPRVPQPSPNYNARIGQVPSGGLKRGCGPSITARSPLTRAR